MQIDAIIAPLTSDAQNHSVAIYECVHAKLITNNIDHVCLLIDLFIDYLLIDWLALQEVKEKSIVYMCALLSRFGDTLATQLTTTMPLLVDRMRNEISRLTTVKVGLGDGFEWLIDGLMDRGFMDDWLINY